MATPPAASRRYSPNRVHTPGFAAAGPPDSWFRDQNLFRAAVAILFRLGVPFPKRNTAYARKKARGPPALALAMPEVVSHRKRIEKGPVPDVAVRAERGRLWRGGGPRRRREPGPRRLRQRQVRRAGCTYGPGTASFTPRLRALTSRLGSGLRERPRGAPDRVGGGCHWPLSSERDAVTPLSDHGGGRRAGLPR